MRATQALFCLLVFAVLLSLSGVSENMTLGQSIITSLSVLTADSWLSKIVVVTGGVVLTGLALYFGNQTSLTIPMVVALLGFLSLPVGIYGASGMPTLVQVLISGFWLFFMISGVGGAVRGEL
jgi:hypothetical protein